MKAEAKEVVEAMATLSGQLSKVSATIAGIAAWQHSADLQFAEVGAKIDRVDERVTEELGRQGKRLDISNERLDLVVERLDGLNDRVDRVSVRVDGMSIQLDQTAEHANRNTERVDRMVQRFERLIVRVDRLANDYTRGFTERDDRGTALADRVGALERDVAEMKSEREHPGDR
jgi:archaellum component FlaC